MAAVPPLTNQRPFLRCLHGHNFSDPYFYLRNLEDPTVRAYLAAENHFAADFLKPLKPLKDKIFQELKGRLNESDQSVPAKSGPFEYFWRFDEGKEYRVYLRREVGKSAGEVILNCNLLAENKPYFKLGILNWSHDHRWLAFSEDHDGSEVYQLRFKNLESGMLSPEVVDGTSYGGAWAKDNKTFYYVRQNENLRPYQVWSHVIGTDTTEDQLLLEETDGRYFISCWESMSCEFIFIESHGVNTSEMYFFRTDEEKPVLHTFAPRTPGVEYTCYHQGDRFLMLTNAEALDFKISWTPLDKPEGPWQTLIEHEEGCLLESLEIKKDYLAIFYKKQGSESVRILGPGGLDYVVELPEPFASVSPGEMYEYDSQILRIAYSSMVSPQSIYDFDMQTKHLELRKVQEIPSGYDRELYKTERLFAAARDKTLPGEPAVPLTIVHRQDLKKDGNVPVYLFAYGAYGIGITPSFSTNWLSLLDRGFLCAVAHVRGGDDLGRGWYEQGKLQHKRNSFEDLIACARSLIESGWTKPGRIVIVGGSAGGLLVGAVANMAPDLMGGVVAHVPFVDCINTMLDPDLPLTQTEYNEWGNPNDKEVYEYMLSYSPYENVKAQDYPPMLVTAGLNDPRVTYWEPAKWCARLRELKTDNNPLVFKIHMDAGHAGKSGRFASLDELAEEYVFILKVLGLEQK